MEFSVTPVHKTNSFANIESWSSLPKDKAINENKEQKRSCCAEFIKCFVFSTLFQFADRRSIKLGDCCR